MSYSCIACSSARVSRVGALPVFTPDWLGTPFDESTPVTSLYHCQDCKLHFRAPATSESELANYYSALSSDDWWQHGEEREVWREMKKILESAPGRRVLDVGCFRGDLLSYLGDSWERFGVEPSSDARRVAESRGIGILGSSVEGLESDQKFDAITLVDVIEHLPRPLESLRKLVKMLTPGGLLLVFTGNTQAWSWRFAGRHYWYSALPEHVAFFNPAWFRWAVPKLNCRVESIRRMRFEPAPIPRRIDEALKNVAYVTYQKLSQAGLGAILAKLPVVGRIGKWNGCWWTTARDHILVTLVSSNK